MPRVVIVALAIASNAWAQDALPPEDGGCVDGGCSPDPCLTANCPLGFFCATDGGLWCYDPCDGVSCPPDDYCNSGKCIDRCFGIFCSLGRVCEHGQCVPQSADASEPADLSASVLDDLAVAALDLSSAAPDLSAASPDLSAVPVPPEVTACACRIGAHEGSPPWWPIVLLLIAARSAGSRLPPVRARHRSRTSRQSPRRAQ